MKILISGASGLVGKALVNFFSMTQHDVFKLVRRPAVAADEISWSIKNRSLELSQIEGFDAFIHLNGENIFGRWTELKKKKIKNSRIKSTALLAEAITKLKRPPKTFISASAIGYYGSRASQSLSENSKAGSGFLADVCRSWEKAAQLVENSGVRAVQVRTAVVLAVNGGALAKMKWPHKLCLGATLGTGQQYFSWISLDDLVAVYNFILLNSAIKGPVNAAAPYPVENREFSKTLAAYFQRISFLRVPKFVVSALFGEMATETVLASQRVLPTKLIDAGFKFTAPRLMEALEKMSL